MSNEQVKKDHQFTVVMRGPSAVVFRQNESLLIEKFPSESGLVDIIYMSRWIKKNETIILPGQLWIEIKGYGNHLEELIVPFANAGLSLIPLLSLSANAAIGSLEVEIAFDSTPNITERDYFQSYLPSESNTINFIRLIDVNTTLMLLNAIKEHPEAERLHRAANQYQLALNSWKLGHETLSLAHLWMALEALTKAKIRDEFTKKGVTSEKELANSLGVELEQLDSTIRQDLILDGDKECYAKSKKASDGFEHGFLTYEVIRKISQDIRYRMAKYIRNAIFELTNIDSESHKILTSAPYDKPMGYWSVVKYIRGNLLGDSSDLAAEGNAYPFLRWKPDINMFEISKDGKINIQFTENLTPEIGKSIRFKQLSLEVWKPE